MINNAADAYKESSDWILYLEIGDAYIWVEAFDSARVFLERANIRDLFYIKIPRFQADLALAYYHSTETEQARSIIDQLIQKSEISSVGSPAYFTGWFYSWIGELDSAFFWLEKAYENRSPEFPWLKVDPAFNSLKGDDRYWDLYERTGHKAYDEYLESRK